MNNKTLYIFIDESGNFDFTERGTKYFIMTAVSTTQPLNMRDRLFQFRYDLLGNGIDQEYFHATEDKQIVRDRIFDMIDGLGDLEVDCVIAQKNKVNPSLYIEKKMRYQKGLALNTKFIHHEEKFYHQLSQMLLGHIFQRYSQNKNIEKIVVILGSIFTHTKRAYVLKSLKNYFKQFEKQFYIYFHTTGMDINCQIADYCGWAIYIKSERGEMRPYEEMKGKIKSSFDIFETSEIIYYPYKK